MNNLSFCFGYNKIFFRHQAAGGHVISRYNISFISLLYFVTFQVQLYLNRFLSLQRFNNDEWQNAFKYYPKYTTDGQWKIKYRINCSKIYLLKVGYQRYQYNLSFHFEIVVIHKKLIFKKIKFNLYIFRGTTDFPTLLRTTTAGTSSGTRRTGTSSAA